MNEGHDQTSLLQPGLLVGGEWSTAGSGGCLEHVNPSTGRIQATFPLAGPAEVADAVAAARSAFPAWRRTPPLDRRAVLNRIGELIREHADELAAINALEVGTPAALSRARYRSGATAFEYHAGWVDRLTGDTIPMDPGRLLDMTLLEPVGVVAAILTWNHPLANIQMVVAPALAAGCCVVIKPSEAAPFAPVRFGRLCEEAGLPKGVVNILPGGPEAGRRLGPAPRRRQDQLRRRRGDRIPHSGGRSRRPDPARPRARRQVGRDRLPRRRSRPGLPASPSASPATAARAAPYPADSSCTSGSTNDVLDRLLPTTRRGEGRRPVRRGHPHGSGDQRGCLRPHPVDDRPGRARARRGRSSRAASGSGASSPTAGFLPPTVFGDVDSPESGLAEEEIFGPVLAVSRFSDEEEADLPGQRHPVRSGGLRALPGSSTGPCAWPRSSMPATSASTAPGHRPAGRRHRVG